MKKPIIIASSGGKDSTLGLHRIYYDEIYSELYEPVGIMTTFHAQTKKTTAHNIRYELMEKHAKSLGLSLHPVFLERQADHHSYHDYAEKVGSFCEWMKSNGIHHIMYGDICLKDVKSYRDQLIESHHIEGIYPLWGYRTVDLIHEFLKLGYKADIVAVNKDQLTPDYLGKTLGVDLIQTLPPEVDPCGENGEFHTFCYDGPIFKFPVSI